MKDGKKRKKTRKVKYLEGYISGILSDKHGKKCKIHRKGFMQAKIEVKDD